MRLRGLPYSCRVGWGREVSDFLEGPAFAVGLADEFGGVWVTGEDAGFFVPREGFVWEADGDGAEESGGGEGDGVVEVAGGFAFAEACEDEGRVVFLGAAGFHFLAEFRGFAWAEGLGARAEVDDEEGGVFADDGGAVAWEFAVFHAWDFGGVRFFAAVVPVEREGFAGGHVGAGEDVFEDFPCWPAVGAAFGVIAPCVFCGGAADGERGVEPDGLEWGVHDVAGEVGDGAAAEVLPAAPVEGVVDAVAVGTGGSAAEPEVP